MPITPKSAEQIVKEFDSYFVEMHPLNGHDAHNRPMFYDTEREQIEELRSFLRSSLASFLVYASRKSYPTAEYFMLDPRILKDTTAAIRIGAMQEFHHNLLSLAESISKTEV